MELQNVRELANNLLKEHKLFWTGWRVEFDDAKTYYGTYNHRTKRIFLSRYLLAQSSAEAARAAILHLMAHVVAGYQTVSHDERWQQIAAAIGAGKQASLNGIRFCKIRQPDLQPAASQVAQQFMRLFKDPRRVLEMAELAQLTAFNFADYEGRLIPIGAGRAFLECKIWKRVGENQLMKLYFLAPSESNQERRFVFEVWQSKFTAACLTPDNKTDLRLTEIGKWYEVLTAADERTGAVRLQSLKKLKTAARAQV